MRKRISRMPKVKTAKKASKTKHTARGRRLSLKDLETVTGGFVAAHVCCG